MDAAAAKIQRWWREKVLQVQDEEDYIDYMNSLLEDERNHRMIACQVCYGPCDPDWAWTGHCSRWCANSRDRNRDRW